MAVISPEDFAALLANMPQDMATKAAATAAAAGGAAAEAVEIFEDVGVEAELGFIASVRALMAASWKARATAFVVQTLLFLGIERAALWVFSKGFSSGFALLSGLWPNMTGQMALNTYKNLDTFTPIGLNLTAGIYEHIFPGSMNAAEITESFHHNPVFAADAGADSDFFGVMGDNVQTLFAYMFDEPGVRVENLSRTASSVSYKNFRRVMGANLGMQIRAQTMAVVAQMFPLGPLRHIGDLHQSLVSAMGLNRLAHTMLSVLASNLIHRGIQQDLNRNLLPRDLSETEAFDATLMALLAPSDRDNILNNEGVRLDIRPTLERMRQTHYTESQAASAWQQGRIGDDVLIDAYNHHKVIPEVRSVFTAMAETDLPDTDVQNLYQKGRLDESDLYSHFRWKGYGDTRAQFEQATIVEARTWDLLDKITESYGRLYRDEVVSESEFRTWLSSNNWTSDEMDLRIAWEELERRQRTFLSNAELTKAVTIGMFTMDDFYGELLARGYTPEDAAVVMSQNLALHLPACDKEKVKDSAVIAFLQGIGAQAGVNPGLLKTQLLRYLQCLDENVPLILPIASLKVTPDHVLHAGVVTLEWDTTFALSAHIEPGIGPVPLSGKTQVQVSSSKSYTLTAVNPLGQTKAYAFINVTEA